MSLSDAQLKFLESFVLRRNLEALGAKTDPAAEPDRAGQRHGLLQRLAGAGKLEQGLPGEQKTLGELVQQVRHLLKDETPTQDALDKAGDALKKLNDHVEDVQKEITRVRKPRFEKGQAALAALRNISLELPTLCPQDARQALAREHGELTALLAPMKGWTNVTVWDEEDLISIDLRLDRLAIDAKKLRQEVEAAVQALESARAAATKAMTQSGAVEFSDAQTAQMSGLFQAASEQARSNVLQADEPIRALEKLVKHAAATAQLRAQAGERIAALPETAPVGATLVQKGEWVRLRKDALAAMDEVLES